MIPGNGAGAITTAKIRACGHRKNSAAGFTLNFAHRQAYAILVLLLIAPIMIVLLIELLK